MRYFIYVFVLLMQLPLGVMAQKLREDVTSHVEAINKKIDQAIVEKDIPTLNQLYADDFIFTHGTGTVDSKQTWIKNVENPVLQFISRTQDSTIVELHAKVAIVLGKLVVQRQTRGDIANYAFRYLRIFVLEKKSWKLISHRTISEWDL